MATAPDLARLPPDVRAEIIGGELVEKACLSAEHADAQGSAIVHLRGPYHRRPGGGQPDGWWIRPEVEIELVPHRSHVDHSWSIDPQNETLTVLRWDPTTTRPRSPSAAPIASTPNPSRPSSRRSGPCSATRSRSRVSPPATFRPRQWRALPNAASLRYSRTISLLLTVRALRGPRRAFTFGSMAQVGQLDFKRYLETHKGPAPGPKDEAAEADRGHAYSYVSDRNMRTAFTRMRPVELAVTAAVRLFKAVGKNQLLGNAVRVGPNQFPRVHGLVMQCAETLGITPPTLYITNSPVMNAMTFGTNDDSFIIVHSALIDYFTDEELLSVIGHEAGHIHNNHVVYLTALFYLRNMASIFLKWVVYPAELALSGWMRRAEITCDRAGLLCCKDVDTSRRALAKLALGSTKLREELNLDAFAEQYEEGKAGVGRYAEFTASHPWISKRLKALKFFGESELYRQHAGLGAGGLTMDQVDEKVHEVIKVS